MCHLGFVGMCGYFLPNCAFLFLLKSKFKKQMNNQTYRDRDRGEWHNISLELSRQHRRLHRKTKGDVPDFTTRDNKLFPNLKKKKKSCSDLHNSFFPFIGNVHGHSHYIYIMDSPPLKFAVNCGVTQHNLKKTLHSVHSHFLSISRRWQDAVLTALKVCSVSVNIYMLLI